MFLIFDYCLKVAAFIRFILLVPYRFFKNDMNYISKEYSTIKSIFEKLRLLNFYDCLVLYFCLIDGLKYKQKLQHINRHTLHIL